MNKTTPVTVTIIIIIFVVISRVIMGVKMISVILVIVNSWKSVSFRWTLNRKAHTCFAPFSQGSLWNRTRGRYHGGRGPSSDDSFHSHSTIGTRQTEYREALPSSASVQSRLTSSFTDDGNASWYWVCRVSMVEWRLDCENCRHLTVFGLHDTGPRIGLVE